MFAAPAYWPALSFGGPVPVLRALARELIALGHHVDVVTTTLIGIGEQPARASRTDEVDGATVHYLGTPLRFRWFGVAPSLAPRAGTLPRPDVVHVFGYRDWVSTVTARWCRVNDVPYVFEPLGMFAPKLRKVALKRALDRTLYRAVPRGATLAIGASERERRELEAVVPPERVVVPPERVPGPVRPAPGPARCARDSGSTRPRRSSSPSAGSRGARGSSSSSPPSPPSTAFSSRSPAPTTVTVC